MRPRFVLALLFLSLLILSAVFYLKRPLRRTPAPSPEAETATAATVTVSNAVTNPAPPAESAPVIAAAVATNVLSLEQHEAAIDAETDRLQQWSVNDDPTSLSNILADLTNPEKEIREAAIEATRQFGSADAIPALKSAAVNSTDTDEQIEMLEAAKFLSLPGISDIGVQLPRTPAQIQADAQRQAERQKHDPIHHSQAAPNN